MCYNHQVETIDYEKRGEKMKRFNRLLSVCISVIILTTSCSFTGGKYYEDGIKKLEIKEYEAAEESFKQAIDKGYTDNKVDVIYTIISSYNNALKLYNSKEYDDAQEYLDKIPNSYTEYIISHDVDVLKHNMEKHNEAYNSLKRAKTLVEQGKYADANAVILLIDDTMLSDQQVEEFEDLKKLITLKQKNENAYYIKKIDDLVENYVYALCDAVNENQFKALQGCLYKGSAIYNLQKSYISKVGPKEIYEYVYDYSVSNIDWISEDECVISTVEVYNIYNGDDYSRQTFKYTYHVIETEDKQLYLTELEKSK